MPNDDILSVATELRSAIFRLSRRLRGQRALPQLSDTQLAILSHLLNENGRTPGELAEREHVSNPVITRALNDLEASGYVRRASMPGDGRKVRVMLTRAGSTVMAETKQIRDAWMASRLAALSDLDLAAMRRAAELMQSFASDRTPGGPTAPQPQEET